MIIDDIKQYIAIFKQSINVHSILTEDDLRCQLFCFLNSHLKKHSDRVSIHSEIRWYGDKRPNGTKPLKYRSDIVIIDKSTLQQNNTPIFSLPSKGYGFSDYFAVIEIKLRRPNGTSNNRYNQAINDDTNKLKEIKRLTSNNNNPIFCLISLDKKNNLPLKVDYINRQ